MNRLSKLILIGFVAFAGAILFTTPANALGAIGPDPGDFTITNYDTLPTPGDGRLGKGFFTLAEILEGDVVSIDRANAKVYFDNNSGTKQVNIYHGDACKGSGSNDLFDGVNLTPGTQVTPGANNNIARYQILKVQLSGTTEAPTTTVVDQVFGKYKPAPTPPDDCGSYTLSIPGNQLVYSPNIDKWVAYFRADRLGTNGENVFRVTAVGGIVGMVGDVDAKELGMNLIGRGHVFSRIDLPFAADCSVTAPRFERIRLFDPDNGRPVAQPIPFTFHILERDKGSTGPYRVLDKTEYRNWSNMTWMPSNGSNPNGPGMWRPVDNPPSNSYAPVEALFKPGKQYLWRFWNVYDRNNIQYELPFDQVYNDVNCPTPYELSPQIEATPSSFVTIPNPVTFNFFTNNQNSSSPAINTNYSLRIYDDNGVDLIPPRNNVAVTIPAGATHHQFFSQTINPTTTNMGGRVCATLTIQPADSSNPNQPATVGPVCVIIGKAPYTQVRGGDMWVGGNFPASDGTCSTSAVSGTISGGQTTSINGVNYGSWGEYGVTGIGEVRGFGSAAQAAAASLGKQLTFANTPQLGLFDGNNPPQHCITDLFSHSYATPTTFTGNTIDLSTVTPAPGTYEYNATETGTLTIRAGAAGNIVPRGRDIIIRTNASNVVINSNIRYENTPAYTKLSDIPRIIILAQGNITIANGVTQVDGWITTKQTLLTCDTLGTLDTSLCNNKLEINGMVAANQVVLRRTAGADTGSPWLPAEVFNLRANDYLRAYSDGLRTSTQQTVFQKELPPRY